MKWRIIILDCENGFMMPFEMLGGALMDFLKNIGLWYTQGVYRCNGEFNEYTFKVSVEKFAAIENELLQSATEDTKQCTGQSFFLAKTTY